MKSKHERRVEALARFSILTKPEFKKQNPETTDEDYTQYLGRKDTELSSLERRVARHG